MEPHTAQRQSGAGLMVTPQCPPYMASARWYARWLGAIAGGRTQADAVRLANGTEDPRGWARTAVGSVHGNVRQTPPLTLSAAVQGGARSLRNASGIDSVSLSGHGDWRRLHLGALEARYGRAPYYQHLIPELREAILTGAPLLRDLNDAIHAVLSRFILRGDPANDATTLGLVRVPELTDVARQRALELLPQVDPTLSIVDALMRLGPESLLPLLVSKY